MKQQKLIKSMLAVGAFIGGAVVAQYLQPLTGPVNGLGGLQQALRMTRADAAPIAKAHILDAATPDRTAKTASGARTSERSLERVSTENRSHRVSEPLAVKRPPVAQEEFEKSAALWQDIASFVSHGIAESLCGEQSSIDPLGVTRTVCTIQRRCFCRYFEAAQYNGHHACFSGGTAFESERTDATWVGICAKANCGSASGPRHLGRGTAPKFPTEVEKSSGRFGT